MFLHEPAAAGERPCVNALTKSCKASVYLAHPQSRIADAQGRKMGVVLREFLDPIEFDSQRSGHGLPNEHHPCYICMLYANQFNVWYMPLSNKPVPPLGFHHATGVPGGYALAATIQSVKNHVDGRVIPVRHFSVSEYIPCVETHPESGRPCLGYKEVARVFYLRGLPTATLQTASRGLAPFTESVAHTERIRFTDLLLRRLKAVFTSETEVAHNQVLMGSFKQLCQKVSTTVDGLLGDECVAEGVTADDMKDFVKHMTEQPVLWTRVRRPELRTHIVAHVCVMREHIATCMKQTLEQKRKDIGFGRSRLGKQEVRDIMEAIAKLLEFIRGHRELTDLIHDRIEHHQPYDDDTLLGAGHGFEYHEFGAYDPDEYRYRLTNADMSESHESATFYSFPAPCQQLAARYTDRVVLTVGSEGTVTAHDIFTDFWDTVMFVRDRGRAWSLALRKTCSGFESVVDEFDAKKQAWAALVRDGCSIITALILRVHCAQILRAERGCDCETAYVLTLFSNTHLQLAEAVDWTDLSQLVDSHLQGHMGVLEQNYPWPTAMLHEGSMDAHDAALNYVGFFDTGTQQQKEHKSWLHMQLKAAPRCCEVRASEGINKSTCVVDPSCGEWLMRCIEASMSGVMRHCENRLSFPAVLAARRLVSNLRNGDNLTKFLCEHQILCKHVMREHQLLLLEYNPVMRDILKLHCSWFDDFTHHVRAFMNRVRGEFAISHELLSPAMEMEYESDLARVTGWNKHVYRWYKRTFSEAVVRFIDEIDKDLQASKRTVPVHMHPSENKCKFMRITLEAICGNDSDVMYGTSSQSSGRGIHDLVIERDCRMLQRFGLRPRAVQIVRGLYMMYLTFVKRKRFMEQILRLAPDEYALVRSYYNILVDAQCVHQYNINSAEWNHAVLDALCIKFDLDRRSDVPVETTTLVTTPCCRSIATQLAASDEVKSAKLVSCATITYDTSQETYGCLGRKDLMRRKPAPKKAAAESATSTRRPRRKTTAAASSNSRDAGVRKQFACKTHDPKLLRSFGKICSFTTKYREKREQASQTKHPLILSSCCATWMRYRNSYWRNGFQCLSCAIANGNDPTERTCVMCSKTGGSSIATGKKTSRSSTAANIRTFSFIKVIDDLLVGRVRDVAVCSECSARLPRTIRERLPFMSELPDLYRAGSEHRHARGMLNAPSLRR